MDSRHALTPCQRLAQRIYPLTALHSRIGVYYYITAISVRALDTPSLRATRRSEQPTHTQVVPPGRCSRMGPALGGIYSPGDDAALPAKMAPDLDEEALLRLRLHCDRDGSTSSRHRRDAGVHNLVGTGHSTRERGRGLLETADTCAGTSSAHVPCRLLKPYTDSTIHIFSSALTSSRTTWRSSRRMPLKCPYECVARLKELDARSPLYRDRDSIKTAPRVATRAGGRYTNDKGSARVLARILRVRDGGAVERRMWGADYALDAVCSSPTFTQ
ncbi:hypothetical protein DFH07DRAFT_309309 [Mycena maculata]|uniref:Uncharacterized protein n=1 Tax=Mycena maculata TaxID=230809 RepID=A0AAD7MJ80_9AGAR|nr:hypothetical protein DFH07DRAFT_309309 [Mycena maculata]